MSTPQGIERWWLNSWPHRWHVRIHVPRFLHSSPEPFRGEVLEIGAGYGWTSRQILDEFPQVELTATDIDQTATQKFEKLRGLYGSRLKIKEVDALALPFARNSFDVVLAINVIGRLSSGEGQKVLQEMFRVARPGGLIGISEYSRWFGERKGMRKTDIEQFCKAEGCELVAIQGRRGFDAWLRKEFPLPPQKEI